MADMNLDLASALKDLISQAQQTEQAPMSQGSYTKLEANPQADQRNHNAYLMDLAFNKKVQEDRMRENAMRMMNSTMGSHYSQDGSDNIAGSAAKGFSDLNEVMIKQGINDVGMAKAQAIGQVGGNNAKMKLMKLVQDQKNRANPSMKELAPLIGMALGGEGNENLRIDQDKKGQALARIKAELIQADPRLANDPRKLMLAAMSKLAESPGDYTMPLDQTIMKLFGAVKNAQMMQGQSPMDQEDSYDPNMDPMNLLRSME